MIKQVKEINWGAALVGAAAGVVAGVVLADEKVRNKVWNTLSSLSEESDRLDDIKDAVPHQIRAVAKKVGIDKFGKKSKRA